ncbi:acyl-CoA thioesterase [Alloprevotella sp. OH1205_COT-284]|nr:acyl-CoA thioesterase [Alloprevotella sp. OH1205_COT-284]
MTMTEFFRHRTPIQIRFNDLDSYQHVNNNSYFSFYDLGKESYFADVFQHDFRRQSVVPLIANINADFIEPVVYGDDIVVETRISHLGTKSFTLEQRAVNQKNGRVVCTARTVMVCVDLKKQESVEIPAEYRAAIEAYEAGK